MIKRIDQLYSWIETIMTSILGIVSGYFIYEVQDGNNQKWLMVIIAVVLIVLCEKVLHMIFKKIVNSSKSLRRLLLREHYIEGTWFGKVVNTGDNNSVYGYSLIDINHSDTGYDVSGKVYDLVSESFSGGFGSNDSHYYGDEKTFSYYFTGINLYDGSANDIVGKTSLKVVKSKVFPTEFMGTVFDTKNKNILNISLVRVNEELLQTDDFSTNASFKSLIERLD